MHWWHYTKLVYQQLSRRAYPFLTLCCVTVVREREFGFDLSNRWVFGGRGGEIGVERSLRGGKGISGSGGGGRGGLGGEGGWFCRAGRGGGGGTIAGEAWAVAMYGRGSAVALRATAVRFGLRGGDSSGPSEGGRFGCRSERGGRVLPTGRRLSRLPYLEENTDCEKNCTSDKVCNDPFPFHHRQHRLHNYSPRDSTGGSLGTQSSLHSAVYT